MHSMHQNFRSTIDDDLQEPLTRLQNSSPSLSGTKTRRQLCVGLLVFLALVGFLFLMIIPIDTQNRTPEFRINAVSTSPIIVSASASEITADWNITFSVANPKKGTNIMFDSIDAWLYKDEAFLSKAKVRPFFQGPDEERVLHASFVANPTHVDDWVGSMIAADMSRNSAMAFDVLFQANVRMNPESWLEWKALLLVDCNDLKIEFSPDSTISTAGRLEGDGDRSCNVTFISG